MPRVSKAQAEANRQGDPAADRAATCVQLATMMGALLLARATDPLSSEIIKAARAPHVR